MKNSEFFKHIHDQLDHIRNNQMSHAQKDGAMKLVQLEIETCRLEVENEVYEQTYKFKVEIMQDVLSMLDRIQRDIAKKSPLQSYIDTKKKELERKAPFGLPYDDEIPF